MIAFPETDAATLSPRSRYREDGAVIIKGAFNPEEMDLVDAAFTWKLENPGPAGVYLYPDEEAIYFQALGNSWKNPAFARLLDDSSAADIAADLFGSPDVWYVGEQIFLKDGGSSRRTPWHQDGSFMPFAGNKIAIMWIPLDPLPKEACLELIRGSHRGPLYNAMTFNPDDDTDPLYDDADFPRLPDVEADRDRWDIMSAPIERGDAIVFHTRTLHGGAPTMPGLRRRSLTLRFIGDDAVRSMLPEIRKDRELQYFDGRAEDALEEDLEVRFRRLSVGTPLHQARDVKKVRPLAGSAKAPLVGL